MALKIEKGIDVPPKRGVNPEIRGAMTNMNIGESFVTEDWRIPMYCSSAHTYGDKHFTYRKISGKGESTKYRVWRIE